MIIIKVCLFAIIGAFSIIIVREQNKEIGILLSVVCSLGITFAIIEEFSGITQIIVNTIDKYNINVSHISIAVKTVCIGYFAQLSIDLLEDMGAKSIASKVSLCAKIIIISISIPLVVEILQIIESVLWVKN